jgi:hypothetical protein
MKNIFPSMMLMAAALTQTSCAMPAEPTNPEDLIAYIRAAERAEIRESWGEAAGECFTWDDYESFKRDDRPAAVAARLKASPQFRKLVEMIKTMPQRERVVLLSRARQTARPTWAMNGRISRDGTTDAGRQAGLMMAAAITGVVQEALGER